MYFITNFLQWHLLARLTPAVFAVMWCRVGLLGVSLGTKECSTDLFKMPYQGHLKLWVSRPDLTTDLVLRWRSDEAWVCSSWNFPAIHFTSSSPCFKYHGLNSPILTSRICFPWINVNLRTSQPSWSHFSLMSVTTEKRQMCFPSQAG